LRSSSDDDVVTSEEEREFVQRRIALFAKVLFLVDLAFTAALVPVVVASPALGGRDLALNMLPGVLVLSVLGGTWWTTARWHLSPGHLWIVELLPVLAISFLLAVSAYVGWDVEPQRYGVTIGAMLVSMTRVFVVPSTWRRTAVISAVLAVGPLSGILLRAMSPMHGIAASAVGPLSVAVLWGLPAIAVASVGSKVIFGLRREIREARKLGQYTLGRKIGEGGMGQVYLAQHNMLRRPTAIKLLPPERMGENSLNRFEREVRLTATLTHPNTVSVFDYGRSADGIFYYAMEYLKGLDLATLVAQFGPQPWGRVVFILRQIASALREAHDRGLIHRDIKPANVILTRAGGDADFVKVVDFGLVRDLEAVGESTTTNSIAGTPAYLAPEAVTHPEAVDPRTDIYALGAVGYFLVVGEDVFVGKTVVEVLSLHLHEVPTPPSNRGMIALLPELEALLMRCLEKDPAARPQSAAEVVTVLDTLRPDPQWSQANADSWWQQWQESQDELAPDHAQTALGERSVVLPARRPTPSGR
jgi:serine/threonine-protein kinase